MNVIPGRHRGALVSSHGHGRYYDILPTMRQLAERQYSMPSAIVCRSYLYTTGRKFAVVIECAK